MISRNLSPLFQCTLPLLFTLSSVHLAHGAPQAAPSSYSVHDVQELNPEFTYLLSEIGAAERKSATTGNNNSSATASSNVTLVASVAQRLALSASSASGASIAQQLALSASPASVTSQISAASVAALPTPPASNTATASSASVAQQNAWAGSSAYAASLNSSSTANRFVAATTPQVTPTSQLNTIFGGSAGNASTTGNISAVTLPAAFHASPSSLSGGGILLFLGNATSGVAMEQGPSSSAGVIPTITTLPPGMSIQTITSTKCSTLGAMATTTAAGSTVTQVVPKLCDLGFAYLLFGALLPGIATLLCRARLSILGFLLGFLCQPKPGGGLRINGMRIIGGPPFTPTVEGGDAPPQYPYPHDEEPPPYSPSPNGPEDSEDPDDEPTNTDSQPSKTDSQPSQTTSQPSQTNPQSSQTNLQSSQTNSRPSSITSSASRMSSTVSSASCTNTVSGGGCCSNSTVLTLSGIGPTTLCNLAIDTWVDVAYDFVTGSIALPASASPIAMPATPITVSDADAVFSSLASAISSYLASISGLPSNNTANATLAASISQPTPTAWVTTTVSGSAFCSSGHDIAGLSTTTVDGTTSSWCATPGATAPSCGTTSSMGTAYCTCGADIAPLSTTVIAGTTSSWCPTPGVVVPTGPAKLSSSAKPSIPPPTMSSAPAPVETAGSVPAPGIASSKSCDDYTWYDDEAECDAVCFPETCTEIVDGYSNAFPSWACECKSEKG